MDRQDAFQFGLFIVFFVYLSIVGSFTTGILHDILGYLGIFGMIGAFIAEEWVLMWMASNYGALVVIIRPTNKKLFLFHDGVYSKKIAGSRNDYMSRIVLGKPIEYEPYGEVKEIIVHHEHPWGQRVHYDVGATKYEGFRIKHTHMADLELYERKHGTFDLSFLEPIPVFDLRSGSGDYYLQFNSALETQIDKHILDGMTETEVFDLDIMVNENKTLKDELREVKRQAMDWHQAAVRTSEQLEQVQNEMAGLMKSKPDFRNAVVEEFLVLREIYGGIDNALKNLQEPKFGFTWDWKMGSALILGLSVTLLAYFKWDSLVGGSNAFMIWISVGQNQILIITLALIGAGVAYWSKQRGKTKR